MKNIFGFGPETQDHERWFSMSETAKLINIPNVGRSILYEFLREKQIIFGKEPYQKFVNQDLFKCLLSPDTTIITLRVSPKGLEFIKKLLEDHVANGGNFDYFKNRDADYNDSFVTRLNREG